MQVTKKIKLIDEICKKHPSYGTQKGWSEYVGGMKDTGQWFFRKMFNVPEIELQAFLNDIIAKENKPIQPQLTLSQQQDAHLKIWEDMEYQMVFGKV